MRTQIRSGGASIPITQDSSGLDAGMVVVASAGQQELIDNTGTYLYEGFAPYGTATSATSWVIIRSTLDGGGISSVTRADGNSTPDNVWDNRASLSYS